MQQQCVYKYLLFHKSYLKLALYHKNQEQATQSKITFHFQYNSCSLQIILSQLKIKDFSRVAPSLMTFNIKLKHMIYRKLKDWKPDIPL